MAAEGARVVRPRDPLERLAAVAERNAAQVARNQALQAAMQQRAANEKAKLRRAAARARAVADAKEKVREQKQAERTAARDAAKRVRDAAKRAALKEAWRTESASAAARGQPFESDEAQRAYMDGKRSLERTAAKAIVEREEVTGSVIGEGNGWQRSEDRQLADDREGGCTPW